MKKLMLIVAAVAALAGCTTSITAEKHAEVVLPLQEVVTVNGTEQVITKDYLIASGGWEASATSPVFATEALTGLGIEVHTNGTVTLSIDKYDRDLSDNTVALTKEAFDGIANLASKIGSAIATAGGSAGADALLGYVKQFVVKGGDPAKATVTVTDGKITCTDGSCTDVFECPGGNCIDAN